MDIRGKDSFPLLYNKKGKTMGEYLRMQYEIRDNFKERKENLNGVI